MGACLENYQTVINLIESDAWQGLLKLSINKTFANNLISLKKNEKYFSSIYSLRNEICLYCGTVNCCRTYLFVIYLKNSISLT